MRKPSLQILLGVAAASLLAGCSTISPQEQARAGETYELTQPWCHAEFSDGTAALMVGKCREVEKPGSFVKLDLPAGTCLKLGAPHVSYPDLVRTAVYEVDVAGRLSTISDFDLPRPGVGKALVQGHCRPTAARNN